jgi:epsilon-lactone hydrolase
LWSHYGRHRRLGPGRSAADGAGQCSPETSEGYIMTSLIPRLLVCVLAALALAIPGFVQDPSALLRVPAREVPVPATVSPELQKVVAVPIPPAMKAPSTADGWKKLQRESDAIPQKVAAEVAKRLGATVTAAEVGGVKCYRVTPKVVAGGKEKFLIVHVHRGAYVFNGGLAATTEAVLLADACKTAVLSIDYRMPPDHPFPAATDDVLAVWKAVLNDHDPGTVVMGGTSAGAALTMTTMLRCKADKVAMPAALFLGTPLADLTKTGDSVFLNAEVDHAVGRYEGRIEAGAKLYAGGRKLNDPLISPVYGDFSGWPPALLVAGTRDLMLSATIRTHRKLRAAGVTAELHVFEGMSHADYAAAFQTPESGEVLREVATFFDRHLKR